MFYICKKREDGNFGVMDTEDGVVEYYSPHDIIKIASKFHVKIEGLSRKENGKWVITVLSPTKFEAVSDTSIKSESKDADDVIHDSEYYKTRYEKLSEYEITQLAKETALNLARVIQTLTCQCYHGENLILFDGIDCMGYDDVRINDDYSLEIYFNPDVEENRIYSRGFGFDIYHNGKMLDDSHFDSTFDEWEKDFETYKYKYLFS